MKWNPNFEIIYFLKIFQFYFFKNNNSMISFGILKTTRSIQFNLCDSQWIGVGQVNEWSVLLRRFFLSFPPPPPLPLSEKRAKFLSESNPLGAFNLCGSPSGPFFFVSTSCWRWLDGKWENGKAKEPMDQRTTSYWKKKLTLDRPLLTSSLLSKRFMHFKLPANIFLSLFFWILFWGKSILWFFPFIFNYLWDFLKSKSYFIWWIWYVRYILSYLIITKFYWKHKQ